MKIIKNLEALLFFAIILLIPTQLAIHFWPNTSLVFGIRIDYLSPTIYLTDVVLVVLLGVWFLLDIKFIQSVFVKRKKQLLYFSLFVITNIIVSTAPSITLIKWAKLFELFMFALYVARRFKNFEKNRVVILIVLSLVVVSLIGISQFFLGRTIGGPFYFLGERSFTLSTPGIALVQLGGVDYLRAYSIFPHPNALAGYIVVTVFLLLSMGVKKSNFTQWCFVLFVLCLFLSFSLSSLIGLLITLLVYGVLKNKTLTYRTAQYFITLAILTSLLMPLVSKLLINNNFTFPSNVLERMVLSISSEELISEHFLLGVGLNQFIPNLQTNTIGNGMSLILQPVHNIFLLLASEIGVIGLVLVTLLFGQLSRVLIKSNNVFLILIFVFVLVSGFFDHYWLTINQNLLLLSLVVGYMFANDNNPSSPKYI